MGMSEKNVQDLFDALAGIHSRRLGVEIKAVVKKKDEVEGQKDKPEKVAK
ncbi:hypothetical protein [Enterococcus sp. BWR-S5]|nr:hypothetical protein [Enterococcus sp. BWR-S5]MBL1224816.1 hypothetical protein [Enterococcus sp. BWR-S5]